MKLYLQQLLFGSICLVFFLGCDDDPDCDQELPHDDVELVFYDIETLEVTSYKFDQIGALDIEPDEAGSVIYYTSEDSLSNYAMQLSPSLDTIIYFFTTDVSRDTLILSYKRELTWLSDKCGPFVSYDGLEIIDYTFDSIGLTSSVIDQSVDENIQIYR